MVANRRTRFNFALQRAADWARHLGRPLLVLEALRSGYPWASDRLHGFVIQGMMDNRDALAGRDATYYGYVEAEPDAGQGLLETLAEQASVIVTDQFPTFFLPRMVAAAADRVPVLLETVDSNGVIPLDTTDDAFATAYSFRRFLQKHVVEYLDQLPLADPIQDLPSPAAVPDTITSRWPPLPSDISRSLSEYLATLPIDHSVPLAPIQGGSVAAGAALQEFLDSGLSGYADRRNRPDDDAGSGLSPFLHFGHLSSHEVVCELLSRSRWTPEDLVPPANGRRSGWWGLGDDAEGFLDQLLTWRELGFVFCHHRPDHDRYESIPQWARDTLAKHAGDPREHLYTSDEFDAAASHDRLWNAAQNQLRREGRIHNYLRMLWGKKILEWSTEPKEALEIMTELNNRYALDGRDPNSYTGIFWVLGRHDRAWGPERPVFGTVRYMSSENTARKVPVRQYLERYQ
jgi:deoxyribodipyrimidine photo-lyase